MWLAFSLRTVSPLWPRSPAGSLLFVTQSAGQLWKCNIICLDYDQTTNRFLKLLKLSRRDTKPQKTKTPNSTYCVLKHWGRKCVETVLWPIYEWQVYLWWQDNIQGHTHHSCDFTVFKFVLLLLFFLIFQTRGSQSEVTLSHFSSQRCSFSGTSLTGSLTPALADSIRTGFNEDPPDSGVTRQVAH